MKGILSKLLVAVNGNDASIAAAKCGVILAKRYGAELDAVYVVDTATIKQLALSRIFIPEESEEYERSLEENGRRYLAFVQELGAAKRVKIGCHLLKGSIFSEVLSLAEELGSDCIVLGAWERDRPSRDLFTEAHREILANAKCSVLVVRDPEIDAAYKTL